jgi:hypothetical protein
MLRKITRALSIVLTIGLPILVWFMGDIVRHTSGVPDSPTTQIVNLLAHIWAVQLAVCTLYGSMRPIDTSTIGKLLVRGVILAAIGGLVGGYFLRGVSPLPMPLARQMSLSLLLTLSGLIQVSMVGLMAGSVSRSADLKAS